MTTQAHTGRGSAAQVNRPAYSVGVVITGILVLWMGGSLLVGCAPTSDASPASILLPAATVSPIPTLDSVPRATATVQPSATAVPTQPATPTAKLGRQATPRPYREEAVQFLKTRPEISTSQIGLLGHSEGGMIAPIAAASSPDVTFIITMAGPAWPGRELLVAQTRLILQSTGQPEAQVEVRVALEDEMFQAIGAGSSTAPVREKLIQFLRDQTKNMTEEERKAAGDVEKQIIMFADSHMEKWSTPWMKFFINYDPGPTLKRVKVPVLALFGGKDIQVPVEGNREALDAALERDGNKDVQVIIFPDANHLFKTAVTGSISAIGSCNKPKGRWGTSLIVSNL